MRYNRTMNQPLSRPPVSTLMIPRSDLARLQKIQLAKSAREGRRIPLWEIARDAVKALVEREAAL